jgi:pimeloyl-ACP methyl ester carboxylesterase
MALYFFGKPREGRLLPKEKAFLKSAEKVHQIDFEQEKVVLYEWNAEQEDTVLLLHGWESNSARWQPLIEQLLTQGKRVLAVDAPAHGASTGKLCNLLQYSRLLGVLMKQFEPDSVVGHSFGGATVAMYMYEYPDAPLQKMAILGVPSELRDMVDTFAEIVGLSERMYRAMERRFEEQYHLTFDHISIATYCKRIPTSTLVIHDVEDDLAPIEDAYLYQKNLKNSQLVVTRGLGHSLQGQEVYDAVLAFV